MSSIITEILPPRSFETVRQRIGEIITDELARQAYVTADPFLESFDVYMERFVPIDKTEHVVNVALASGEYNSQTVIQQDGDYLFNVDVYTSAKSSVAGGGDSAAMVKLQKVLGLCWAILMHTRYTTLGFAPPFIMNRHMVRMLIKEPDTQNTDAAAMVMGRMVFSVRVAEEAGTVLPSLLPGYDTKVTLGLTDKGFLYIRNA